MKLLLEWWELSLQTVKCDKSSQCMIALESHTRTTVYVCMCVFVCLFYMCVFTCVCGWEVVVLRSTRACCTLSRYLLFRGHGALTA